MQFIRITAALCMALHLAGCVPLRLQSTATAAEGFVIDSITQKPIQKAKVTYQDGSKRSTVTDDNGHFYIDGRFSETHWVPPIPGLTLARPRIKLMVEAIGYTQVEAYFETADTIGETNKYFTITLQPN
jgi:hypothetical protein